jgi:hypothetical protein
VEVTAAPVAEMLAEAALESGFELVGGVVAVRIVQLRKRRWDLVFKWPAGGVVYQNEGNPARDKARDDLTAATLEQLRPE